MNVSGLRVSRWLLVLEWLVCFGPLTLLWVAAVWVIAKGASTSGEMIASTFIGTLGPVALVVAITGTIFSKKVFLHRGLIQSLLAGFLVLGVLQLLAMVKTLGFDWFAFDWSLVVLLSALPASGCLHLLCLAYPETQLRPST